MLINRPITLLLFLSCSHVSAGDYSYEYAEDPVDSTFIKHLTNLEREATQARLKNIPILIEFSTPWCSYCEALEQEVLEPLIVSEEFKDKIIIRKLEVAEYSNIIGLDGKSHSSFDINQRYNIKLYPTLIFIDANGNEISQRIIGITTISYASEVLVKAISEAINQTNKKIY